MNKFVKWGLPGMMACSFMAISAQQINPMMEAVLQNYAEILAENPKDYQTLIDRASQYIELGDYNRALSDVDMALEYTPATDTDYRIAEYLLKSDILTNLKNFQGAVEAVNGALAINPSYQPALYKAGNLYLIQNNGQEALKAFQALQRENPRSQEAFYGMAKANVLLGNKEDAERLISEVENLGKQSYLTYCRIGDLYSDMDNVKEAVTNYTIAFTMEDNSSRPVESLKLLARKNPALVLETLDGIIASKPDNLSLNYLKAILAFDSGMYAQAEKACKDLATTLEEDSPAVYRMMAMSQLGQNKLEEALQSIGTAETLAPGNSGVLLDKATILMTTNPSGAFEAAGKVLLSNPDDESALMLAAKAGMLNGNYSEALNYLNNVILSNPSNVEALLLRGYLNTEFIKDGKAGVADYTRAGNVRPEGNVRAMAFIALGKAKIGKTLDAEGIINDAVGLAGNDKDALYAIALYYAQTGNLVKAKEYIDRALLNGYSNLYNLQTNEEPLLNLKPIRHLIGN